MPGLAPCLACLLLYPKYGPRATLPRSWFYIKEEIVDLLNLIVGNAAGTVKTVEDVRKLEASAVTRITVGSITKEPREGNSGDTYYFDTHSHASLNSIGMRNPGLEWYHAGGKLRRMTEIAHDAGKKLWASVAGFSVEEYVQLAETCFLCGVDGVELNLGCPNVHDGGVSKPIFSYHPESVQDLLEQMEGNFLGAGHEIGVKISPVPSKREKDKNEENILAPLVHAINSASIITEVVAVNTLPKQTMRKSDGGPALSYMPLDGTELMHAGGLAGAPLKAHGLRVVGELLSHHPKAESALYSSIRVIGASGIFSGTDAKEYLDLGAAGFELGTAYYNHENPAVFSVILNELVGLYEPA